MEAYNIVLVLTLFVINIGSINSQDSNPLTTKSQSQLYNEKIINIFIPIGIVAINININLSNNINNNNQKKEI
ncbi:hypothetical protein [Carp edema virus]|nr:hypothetical protein [Carp edema virus]